MATTHVADPRDTSLTIDFFQEEIETLEAKIKHAEETLRAETGCDCFALGIKCIGHDSA